MASRTIESSGDIEVLCHGIGLFQPVSPGDRVALIFAIDAASPPFSLKIFSPSGANVMDTLIRELPTGGPQSPPPIEFVVSVAGTYRIEIKETSGRRQKGEAKLLVT